MKTELVSLEDNNMEFQVVVVQQFIVISNLTLELWEIELLESTCHKESMFIAIQ